MSSHRGTVRRTCAVLAALSFGGCTTLREIPRSTYAVEPERAHVRVQTREALIYEFDFARFRSDTLFGYRRREVAGRVEQFDTLAIPLEEVSRLTVRTVDWRRTGLIGGGVLLAAAIAGLSAASNDDATNTSPGPKPPPEQ